MSSLALTLLIGSLASAQDSPKPEAKPDPDVPANAVKAERNADAETLDLDEFFRDDIKPLPPVAIPDDPPPHEGAFFQFEYVIEPPDIIYVEILEALPGRPITGARLVRPNGTISLGFYGDVYVGGLTLSQAKARIVIHLRKHLLDHVLGIAIESPEDMASSLDEKSEAPNLPIPRRGRIPFDLESSPADEVKPHPEGGPETIDEGTKPGASVSKGDRLTNRRDRATRRRGRRNRPAGPPKADIEPTRVQEPVKPTPEPIKPETTPEPEPGPESVTLRLVKPADSSRAFVDVASYNTKVYYVLGDVGTPGRLPYTGKETVLDALLYAGGLLATGEPADIHLYRPARGGKPAKDYKIDLEAIRRGVATANLQMFPDDRLVIGRNPIVAKTIEVDRAAGLVNSIMNSNLQYTVAARSAAAMNSPPSAGSGGVQLKVNGQPVPNDVGTSPALSPAERDALVLGWAEFLWSVSNKEGGAMLDEKAFGEMLRKKLSPASPPK